MAGLSSLLNTARDAIAAQSFGVNVTGQNISNVNTPGYTRREALLETNPLGSQTTGSVTIEGLRQASDTFTERRLYESTGLSAAADSHDQKLGSVEALFNDASGGGLSSSLDDLFNSFSSLTSNPSDPTARNNVLQKASVFASRANETGDALGQARTDLLRQAQDTSAQVNEKADAIASLNRRIAEAQAAGNDAADLKDQRNKVVLGLASLVDVRTFIAGSGAMVVQSSGTTLVEGDTARSLSVDLASDGSLRIQAKRGDGPGTDVTRFLTGGSLAGIRETRDVDIVAVQGKLDKFVTDVASAINTQHAAGVGLDGTGGRALFSFTAGAGAARSLKLDDAIAGQPSRLAAASTNASLPGGSDNAAALFKLSSAALSGGGTRTASEAYSDIVGDVGSRKAQAANDVEMRTSLLSQAQNARESVSGVSLDEEMVALTKYQRAYDAAAKVLKTVDDMMQELMQRLG